MCSAGLQDVPSTKYGAAAVYRYGSAEVSWDWSTRGHVTACSPLIGCQVRVCGGYDNYYNLRECHVLDLVQGSWSPAPSLTQARWQRQRP